MVVNIRESRWADQLSYPLGPDAQLSVGPPQIYII